jgi:hypothetical protein
MESGEPCTDADFCSLNCLHNYHQGDPVKVHSVSLSAVSDQQPEIDGDFWKDLDLENTRHVQEMLEMNLNNVLCEELNIFDLMERCENDTCLVSAVLSSFFAQGSSCCLELQRALMMNQHDQLLLQAVAFPIQPCISLALHPVAIYCGYSNVHGGRILSGALQKMSALARLTAQQLDSSLRSEGRPAVKPALLPRTTTCGALSMSSSQRFSRHNSAGSAAQATQQAGPGGHSAAVRTRLRPRPAADATMDTPLQSKGVAAGTINARPAAALTRSMMAVGRVRLIASAQIRLKNAARSRRATATAAAAAPAVPAAWIRSRGICTRCLQCEWTPSLPTRGCGWWRCGGYSRPATPPECAPKRARWRARRRMRGRGVYRTPPSSSGTAAAAVVGRDGRRGRATTGRCGGRRWTGWSCRWTRRRPSGGAAAS